MKKRGPLLSVKSKLQSQLVWLIFAAMAIPTAVLGGSLYLLISRIADSNTAPALQSALMEIAGYISLSFPPLTALLLAWAFRRTNQIVGPIERISRELDGRLKGTSSGPIILRPGDQLFPMVDGINALLKDREALQSQPPGSVGI